MKTKERVTNIYTGDTWHSFPLRQKGNMEEVQYDKPDCQLNDQFSNVNVLWQLQDSSDTGAGMVSSGNHLFYNNTNGYVRSIDENSVVVTTMDGIVSRLLVEKLETNLVSTNKN